MADIPQTQREMLEALDGARPFDLGAQTPSPGQSFITSNPSAPNSSGQPIAPEAANAVGVGAPPPPSLGFGGSGTTGERLLSPISGAREAGGRGVESITRAFSQAAGTPGQLQFGKPEQDIIHNYAFGMGSAAPYAQDLLAPYQGPTGLGDTSGLEARLRQPLDASQLLGTGGGVQSYLESSVPGLTGGQAAYEARYLTGDPAFRAQRQREEEASRAALGALYSGREGAERTAAARTTEEADVSRQAKAFFGQKQGEAELDRQAMLAEEAAARSERPARAAKALEPPTATTASQQLEPFSRFTNAPPSAGLTPYLASNVPPELADGLTSDALRQTLPVLEDLYTRRSGPTSATPGILSNFEDLLRQRTSTRR